MKPAPRSPLLPLLFRLALFLPLTGFIGCESTESSSGSASAGVAYYESGVHDPWYYGDYYDDPDIIVTPPIDRPDAPPQPTHPIALPPSTPRPMPVPSIPRAPMPRAR